MNKNTSIKTIKLIQEIGPAMNWNDRKNKQFIEAILALKNISEAKYFLRDIMTEKEIREFSNRLEAASLLTQDVQYNAIIESTGLSSTTIARISKWLKGPLGGYRLILNRITQNQSKLGTGHSNSSKLGKGLSLNS